MNDRLKRLIPDQESVRNNRWLRWLGPTLLEPRLWHFTRRGTALGTALGIFFGLLIPIAQIPLSAGTAVLLRANVPSAIASTLITNPLTFGPIYYAAYQLGTTLVGKGEARATTNVQQPRNEETTARLASAWERVTTTGKPLVLGLAIMAIIMSVLTYLTVSLLWRFKIVLAWRRRHRKPTLLRRSARQED